MWKICEIVGNDNVSLVEFLAFEKENKTVDLILSPDEAILFQIKLVIMPWIF